MIIPTPTPPSQVLPSLLPPSPGQVMSGFGNAAQAIENAVGDAIGGVIGAFTGRPPEGKKDLAIQLPDGRGGRILMPDGVITTEMFRDFAEAVGQGFQAVRQDVARLKTLSAANAARGGMYGTFSDDPNNQAGSGIDPMMLVLLLRDRDNAGTSTSSGPPLDTTTLLLMMMNEGGLGNGNGNRMNGGMDPLMLLLALGKL